MKRILVSVVGQLREFERAFPSQLDMLRKLQQSTNWPDRETRLYLSIVTWDNSYSAFPKAVKSFYHENSEKILAGVLAENAEALAEIGITVSTTVVPSKDYTKAASSFDVSSIDEFSKVAYIHERALEAMLQIECEHEFEFDAVILTRPDLFIEFKSCSEALVDGVDPNSVYYKAANKLTTIKPWVHSSSDEPVQYDQYVDQFNVFGRTAFYAYGLMFSYMCAAAPVGAFLYNPSLHFWAYHYLERFRINHSHLYFMDYDSAIIRSTIGLNTDQPLTVKLLEDIDTQWQQDVDNQGKTIFWLKEFIRHDIPFVL